MNGSAMAHTTLSLRSRTWAARTLAAAVRIGLGALFLFAGATKVADLPSFTEAIANYRILPDGSLTLFVAASLPAIEIACGALLALGLFVRPAALVAGLLMAIFLAGLVSVMARGIDISCGCFGPTPSGGDPVTWVTVLRDALLLAAAVATWWCHLPEQKSSSPGS